MSADSGKPDAAAVRISEGHGATYFLEIRTAAGWKQISNAAGRQEYPRLERDRDNIAVAVADFQRETLLWAAQYLDDIGHGFAANEIRRQFVESEAESCGRGK